MNKIVNGIEVALTVQEILEANERTVAHLKKLSADALVAYKKLRRDAYPTIAEQLDMQYHDTLNGTTTWLDAIEAVKVRFPKPE